MTNRRRRIIASLFIVFLTLTIFSTGTVLGKSKKKYHNWQEVAIDMAKVFDEAIADIEAKDYKAAYDHMNEAYFGYYEVQGFEKNVMISISSKRVDHIEATFSNVKHTLLGNIEGDKDNLIHEIEWLKVKVYKDAMVLDGIAYISDSDELGFAVYGENPVPEFMKSAEEGKNEESASNEKQAEQDKSTGETGQDIKVNTGAKDWATFITAFGLLMREGLEAILVIVAIVTYLIKTGNKKMTKQVYLGCAYAVVASIALSIFIEMVLGGIGASAEMIEGWTMFLAVAVLFYISNWMLSKSEVEQWQKYIDDKVQQSIDKKSARTLVFAAFLAVFREGAELILFYKAAFSSGMNNPTMIIYGIAVGTVVLVIIYVVFRFTTIKLPLKPFFIFTSILLFLMCISFMGKGVVELTEANVISGRTVIPAMNGFRIELLSIYDRAETLIPQIMLALASLWLLLSHTLKKKTDKKAETVK